jgi:hypothetical protein
MSNTESIPVARSDNDREEMAAYTAMIFSSEGNKKEHGPILDALCMIQRAILEIRLA